MLSTAQSLVIFVIFSLFLAYPSLPKGTKLRNTLCYFMGDRCHVVWSWYMIVALMGSSGHNFKWKRSPKDLMDATILYRVQAPWILRELAQSVS